MSGLPRESRGGETEGKSSEKNESVRNNGNKGAEREKVHVIVLNEGISILHF